jgi:lipid-A-disaccharide synthase
MVTAYRVSAIEYLVGRLLIQAPSVILANLVLGQNVVPEFLQGACTAERITAALIPLLEPGEERRRQIEAFSRLDRLMAIGGTPPAAQAADVILNQLRQTAEPSAAATANRVSSARQ